MGWENKDAKRVRKQIEIQGETGYVGQNVSRRVLKRFVESCGPK